MPPFAVIEHFYIPKDVLAGLFPSHIAFMVEHLTFYSAEKRLRTGVIITITFPAHAADHSVFFQNRLIVPAAVLYASI